VTGTEIVALLVASTIVAACVGGACAVLLVPFRVDSTTATVKADLAELADKLDHAMKRQLKRDRDAGAAAAPINEEATSAARREAKRAIWQNARR
jgi:hypothetical protein